jgi:hypothetical protein
MPEGLQASAAPMAHISAPGADLSLPLHGSDMEMMEQISNDLVRGCRARVVSCGSPLRCGA